MEKKNFDSEKAYSEFLKSRLAEISKTRDYSIYAHTIYLYDNYGTKDMTCADKMKSKAKHILLEGLRLDMATYSSAKYGALGATSVYLCDTSKPDIQRMIDYNFSMPSVVERVVVFIAVPTTIEFNGKQVEFSSIQGIHSRNCEAFKHNEEVRDMYFGPNRMSFDSRQAKFSLFESTFGREVPKQFILAAHYINPNEDKVSYVENDKHICNLSEQEVENLQKEYQNKLIKIGLNEDASNIKDVIIKQTEEAYRDANYWNELEI